MNICFWSNTISGITSQTNVSEVIPVWYYFTNMCFWSNTILVLLLGITSQTTSSSPSSSASSSFSSSYPHAWQQLYHLHHRHDHHHHHHHHDLDSYSIHGLHGVVSSAGNFDQSRTEYGGVSSAVNCLLINHGRNTEASLPLVIVCWSITDGTRRRL